MRVLLVSALAALALPVVAYATPTVSAFYYPWYGTAARDGAWLHWSQNKHSPPANIASNYWPARGVYSSADPAVLSSQMAEIRTAGIDQIVVSWWGRGSAEDSRLSAVLGAAHRDGISVAAHIEPYPSRSVASIVADIAYLRGLGISTFFIYRPQDFAASAWAAANKSLVGVQVYAQTPLVGYAAAGGFEGLYTYDVLIWGGDKFARICSEAHAVHLLCLPSVGPGYDAQRATGDPRVKPRRDGATYDAMWRAAIAAGADQVTITSFNEWHEGTQIEPAAPHAGDLSYNGAWGLTGAAAESAYLDRTAYWSALFRRALAARTTVSAH
jgi:hypothetical protein